MVLTCAALHTLKCIFLKHLRPKPVSHNQCRVSKAQTTKILLYNSYLSVFSHHTLTGGTAANLQPEHPDKKQRVWQYFVIFSIISHPTSQQRQMQRASVQVATQQVAAVSISLVTLHSLRLTKGTQTSCCWSQETRNKPFCRREVKGSVS